MAEVALKDEIKWCEMRGMSYESCVETIHKYEQRVVPDTIHTALLNGCFCWCSVVATVVEHVADFHTWINFQTSWSPQVNFLPE